MKQAFVKETGILIVGTLERLLGVALVQGFHDDEQPEYEGTTEVYWNAQITAVDARGRTVYVGDDGREYNADQIEFRNSDDSN